MIAWVKGLHIACLLIWCAGLVYLPLLLARHDHTMSPAEFNRLRMMTRFTYVVVASPAAILAILLGSALIPMRDVTEGWFALKLVAVAGLALFHAHCGAMLSRLGHETGRRPYSISMGQTLIPVLLIAVALWLVLAKPDLIPPLERPEPLWPAAALGGLGGLTAHLPRPPDARTPACHLSSPPRPPGTPPAATAPGPGDTRPRLDPTRV